jgi:hypothetical protein
VAASNPAAGSGASTSIFGDSLEYSRDAAEGTAKGRECCGYCSRLVQ